MRSNLAYIGQEAGFARGASPDSGAGPVGTRGAGVGGLGAAGVRAPGYHHSRPLQGLPGPLRCILDLSSSSWLGTGITPPGTHPVYPTLVPYPTPQYPPVTRTTPVTSTTGTCIYDQFGTRVGEPRGVEYRG